MIGRVGPYVLVEEERGRPGLETYRATRPGAAGFAKTVCIERIDPRYTARRRDIDRIVEAATAAAELAHRTLVQLFELSEEDGVYYMAREHVIGPRLASLLAAAESTGDGKLPPWLTLHIATEILTGLAHIHERGVEHGAIDLDSVVVSSSGEVKLLGTAVYAALDGGPDGSPGDIFQLGLVLQRALAGVDPTDSGFSTFDPSIPQGLGDVVVRMSSPDPRERPATARVVLAEMHRWLPAVGPTRTSADVARAIAALALPAAGRKARSGGEGDRTPVPAVEPVPLVSRENTLWNGDTGEFVHHFVPPRPSIPSGMASEPLLILSFGDGRTERAETLDQLTHLWASSPIPPRLVARPGTAWLDAERFAERAGLEHLIEDDEQLREVTQVGDLAQTSLITVLADLQRRRATGRLMILDGSRLSRRVLDLVDGTLVRVATRQPSDQLPEWVLRRGHTTLGDLPAVFREIIATEACLLDVVARRRRLDLPKLWTAAWLDRLSDPLRARRGRYAFDSAGRPVERNSVPLPAASFLIDAVRLARTPEQLRQWAASNKANEYAVIDELPEWLSALALDPRLTALGQEVARHSTLESALKKMPGDAGAICLVAFLLAETRALSFR